MSAPASGPQAELLDSLTAEFAIPGILAFDLHASLPRLHVTLPTCTATVYLHGAHLTHFQPNGLAPVLYLSPDSLFQPDKAIRGGIPISFPWFASRAAGLPGPSHGFARIQPWQLRFAALAGETLHLTLTLAPSELSRSFGFDHFQLACELIFGAHSGRTLTQRLTVLNTGDTPLAFEQALHTYFAVGDVRQTSVTGLESAPFIDKTDANALRTAPAEPLTLTRTTDSVFPAHPGPITLHDPVLARDTHLQRFGSATAVIWNPWSTLAATLSDLPDDAWPDFLCVEAANTGADTITLAPNTAHLLEQRITVEPQPASDPIA